jgi:hypothetical protein
MTASVSGPGDIYDAGGALVVAGARIAAGAAAGSVLTSDAAGNLALQPPAGGGAVASVNGHTGAVVLAAPDVGADAAGAASASAAYFLRVFAV